ARLVLLGDGPDREIVSRRVHDLGLQGDVELAGEQHDLVPWLSGADVFLLPSEQESFGLAALEAMACEVAVVASRVGGLPEIIDDEVTGFLHAPADLDGMTKSALRLLEDAALRQRVTAAGGRIAAERFCDTIVVAKYEQ